MLIDPLPFWLVINSVSGSFSIPIPSTSTLLGAPLTAQGFRIDAPGGIPTFVLLNAQDLVLGN